MTLPLPRRSRSSRSARSAPSARSFRAPLALLAVPVVLAAALTAAPAQAAPTAAVQASAAQATAAQATAAQVPADGTEVAGEFVGASGGRVVFTRPGTGTVWSLAEDGTDAQPWQPAGPGPAPVHGRLTGQCGPAVIAELGAPVNGGTGLWVDLAARATVATGLNAPLAATPTGWLDGAVGGTVEHVNAATGELTVFATKFLGFACDAGGYVIQEETTAGASTVKRATWATPTTRTALATLPAGATVRGYSGTTLAYTHTVDGVTRLYRKSAGQSAVLVHEGPIGQVALSPSGLWFTTGDADDTLGSQPLPTGTKTLTPLADAADGHLALTGAGKALMLVDGLNPGGIHTPAAGAITLTSNWWVPGAPRYTPVTPRRVLDTRTTTRVPAGGRVTVDAHGVAGLPDSGIEALVLNVTAVDAVRPGWLTVWGSPQQQPATSNVNHLATVPVANQVIVATDSPTATLRASAATQVVVDLLGWFPVGSDYTAVGPTRVQPQVAMAANSTRGIPLLGVGGVPDTGVEAVITNLVDVQPQRAGWLTAGPAGAPRPGTSNINVVAGRTQAGLALLAPGADGATQVTVTHPAGMLADVSGWFPTGGEYTAVGPARVYDQTRATAGTTLVPVLGQGGVPASGVTAVFVSVTVAQPLGDGWATAYPSGVARPGTSTVNFVKADPGISNTALVPVGADGAIAVHQTRGARLVVDVQGWLAP